MNDPKNRIIRPTPEEVARITGKWIRAERPENPMAEHEKRVHAEKRKRRRRKRGKAARRSRKRNRGRG